MRALSRPNFPPLPCPPTSFAGVAGGATPSAMDIAGAGIRTCAIDTYDAAANAHMIRINGVPGCRRADAWTRRQPAL